MAASYEEIEVCGKKFKVSKQDVADVLATEWSVNQQGHIYCTDEGRPIRFHRYIGLRVQKGGRVSFKNQKTKNDCRRSNLHIPENPKPFHRNGSSKTKKMKSQAGQIRVVQATVTAWVAESTDRNGSWKRLAVSFDRQDALEAALEKM